MKMRLCFIRRYPWPLAMRESLFCKRWEVEAAGAVVYIVDTALELPSHPVESGLVRSKVYVVHEMRASGDDTAWAMNMEFNVGGNIPTKLIENFLHGQSRTFGKLSGYFAREDGIARKAEWESRLRVRFTHSIFLCVAVCVRLGST